MCDLNIFLLINLFEGWRYVCVQPADAFLWALLCDFSKDPHPSLQLPPRSMVRRSPRLNPPAKEPFFTGVLYPFTTSLFFNRICTLAAAMVLVSALAEVWSSTPYGRFGNPGQGILTVAIDSRLGWFLMELPCSLVFVYQFFYVGGTQSKKPMPRFFAFMFCCHYLYRGWIFPYMLNVHPGSKNFDVGIAFGSWSVTVLHGYLNAKWYAEHGTHLVAPVKRKKSKKLQIGTENNNKSQSTRKSRPKRTKRLRKGNENKRSNDRQHKYHWWHRPQK